MADLLFDHFGNNEKVNLIIILMYPNQPNK